RAGFALEELARAGTRGRAGGAHTRQRGAPGRAPRRGAGKPPRPRRAGVLRTGPAALSRPRPARVGALRGLGLIGADRPNMGVRALALSGGEPSARRAASESLSIMISIEAILQRFRPVP